MTANHYDQWMKCMCCLVTQLIDCLHTQCVQVVYIPYRRPGRGPNLRPMWWPKAGQALW